MQQELDNYLSVALKRLEQAYNELTQKQSYDEQAEKLKLLSELAKEQIKNENPHSATR